jgi:hypothetical protein
MKLETLGNNQSPGYWELDLSALVIKWVVWRELSPMAMWPRLN